MSKFLDKILLFKKEKKINALIFETFQNSQIFHESFLLKKIL